MTSKTETRDHVAAGLAYAKDVVAGKIPACRYVKLACQRQIDDLARAKNDPNWPYRFDEAAAAKICKFIELMPHIKGEWARRRERIRLEPWQQFILTTIFGWLHKETGMRRFRTAYEEVPRKNAKSTKLSGVSLYMLTVDDEAGAEVYTAATKKKQAEYVFGPARIMAQRSTEFRLRYGVEVFAEAVSVPATGSKYTALDANAATQDGMNIHFVANDELHAHKSRDLYDVLETACGSRAQSLFWNITTAGVDRLGICYEQRTYVVKILEGDVVDDTYFGIIYTIDEGDDWQDESTWRKANPNYGVSVYPDDLKRLATKAAKTPAARNNFLTKRLNVWVNAMGAWMNMDAWDACADESLVAEDFEDGLECYVGLDLASKIDVAAKVKLFVDGDEYYLFGNYYVPRAQVDDGDNEKYEEWEMEGLLTVTEGNVINFDTIKEDIRDDMERYNVIEVPYDPWQATHLATQLLEKGVPMVEIAATVKNFSEAMKELQAAAMDRRLHHDGCPILRWMVSNVVCHYDAKENVYPRKERPENKIDGVVSAIMTVARANGSFEDDEGWTLPDDFEEAAA